MKSGDIVLIEGTEVGVVVTPGERTTKLMMYYSRGGRWSSPTDYATDTLTVPPDGHKKAQLAQANVRRHYGVIPYGGMCTLRARVWPDGKDPAQP